MEREQDFLDQPIRSMQAMLREISFLDTQLPRLTPDGIFGELTLEAILRFQKAHGLPVTGRVDNDTWDAIVLTYVQALPYTAPPRPLNGFPQQRFSVDAGQCCVQMYLVQSMFQALGETLSGIEPAPVNGSHTGPSVRNVAWLQRRSGLPESGVMDQPTWNKLTRLYELFLTRNPAQVLCAQRCELPAGSTPCVRGFPWEPYERAEGC